MKSEDASYTVSSQMAKWLGRRSQLKQRVDTQDAQRTISHDISLTGFQHISKQEGHDGPGSLPDLIFFHFSHISPAPWQP